MTPHFSCLILQKLLSRGGFVLHRLCFHLFAMLNDLCDFDRDIYIYASLDKIGLAVDGNPLVFVDSSYHRNLDFYSFFRSHDGLLFCRGRELTLPTMVC